MASAVLDASAVMAVINGEIGADQVTKVLPTALISSVNYAEVVTKVAAKGMSPEATRMNVNQFQLDTVDLDRDLAERAGLMWVETREAGLSLADRACLALAERERLPAYTADRAWAELDIGVEVRLIR